MWWVRRPPTVILGRPLLCAGSSVGRAPPFRRCRLAKVRPCRHLRDTSWFDSDVYDHKAGVLGSSPSRRTIMNIGGSSKRLGLQTLTLSVGVRISHPQPCAHRRHLQTNIDPLTATIYYWKNEFECKSNYIPVAPYGETSERRGNGNRYSFMGLAFFGAVVKWLTRGAATA